MEEIIPGAEDGRVARTRRQNKKSCCKGEGEQITGISFYGESHKIHVEGAWPLEGEQITGNLFMKKVIRFM